MMIKNGRSEGSQKDGSSTRNIHQDSGTEDLNITPCFTPGTLIETDKGPFPVEQLVTGDKVLTRDNGYQTIRWIGSKHIDGRELAASPHLRPILVRAGALGDDLPARDMQLSPNHRLMVSSEQTALYFEDREVLVSAKHLVNNRGIYNVQTTGTTYIHFLFDRHELVRSNGSWTESFQPVDYSLRALGNAQRQEILELFPELRSKSRLERFPAARKILNKLEIQRLSE